MTRDASFSFPASGSSSLALHSTNPSSTPTQGSNLGPEVSALETGLIDFFGRVKNSVNAVNGLRL